MSVHYKARTAAQAIAENPVGRALIVSAEKQTQAEAVRARSTAHPEIRVMRPWPSFTERNPKEKPSTVEKRSSGCLASSITTKYLG